MTFEVLESTDYTAYRCCVCGWRVEVDDAQIDLSSVCKSCAADNICPGYIPIPWTEWTQDLDAPPPMIAVRNAVGPFK